jgi:hypothetical protein
VLALADEIVDRVAPSRDARRATSVAYARASSSADHLCLRGQVREEAPRRLAGVVVAVLDRTAS